jgi:serine protease Do
MARSGKTTRGSISRVASVAILCLAVFYTPAFAASGSRAQLAKELSGVFSAAAKNAMPAVVSIKVSKTIEAKPGDGQFGLNDPFGQFDDDLLRRFFGDQAQRRGPQRYFRQGQGSGFIISKDGYILTNNHVVGDVDKITVTLQDGRTFDNAKVIGADPESEVALIKIDGDNFPVLPMGDSSKVEIADWVLAIGNPFGLSETVTVGVVSAVGRSNVHIAQYEDFIQTDAAVNPGNSGGPLIDLDGNVIGINTAIVSQSGGYMGIGFAIPINMAKEIQEQLKANGKVVRGYLGLYGQDLTPDMAQLMDVGKATGVIVSDVAEGSPAESAGLKSSDIIQTINGKKVASYDQFRNEIAMLKPGVKVQLGVLRDGKTIDLSVTLGERPASAKSKSASPGEQETPSSNIGLRVQNLTRDLANQLGYDLGEGVVVASVTPGTPAGDAGIEAGDLITSVNRQKVTTVAEFNAAMKAARKAGKALLLVKRGQISQYMVIQFK